MNANASSKVNSFRIIAAAVVLGVLATAFLDIINYLQHVVFNKPLTRYEYIGRWVIYLTDGIFSHQSIKAAEPRVGELLLGWIGHYGIGVAFAALMLAFTGLKWIQAPSFFTCFYCGSCDLQHSFFYYVSWNGLWYRRIINAGPYHASIESFAISFDFLGWPLLSRAGT